ncbi:MAG: hypothetical protein PSV17_04235 [Methylotenera sp.]|uniref:ABC-three component system protein n=1 Tax=Methylotenera sp. TaxID=2051956 RepID=UPI002488636E|nr:ABC-three component system protein [Methylotenera sp.]MDI1308627.1 hypothetical protein [Methylotenera sp.]
MFTSQNGNLVQGDLVAGDKEVNNYFVQSNGTAIVSLYSRLRSGDQAYKSKISEQLQHYCNESTDGDVRGLEVKLHASNRQDMLRIAARLKQDATMLIMKYQTSPIAQDILTLVLSKIYSDFLLQVTPSIEEGASRSYIDNLIVEKVINPAIVMLGENDLMITDADVLGLLYYLGGNCHVRWDKC